MDNKIISSGTMKKAGVAMVACVVALGGLGWYGHQQKLVEFHNVVQANSKIVETRLNENNIEVISESQAKEAAAQAMGVDASGITWKEIFLCDGPTNHYMGMGHRFNGHRGPGRNGAGPYCNGWDENRNQDNNGQNNNKDNYDGHWGSGYGHRYRGGGWQGSFQPDNQVNNTDNKAQAAEQDKKTNGERPKIEFHPMYSVICEANDVNYMVHVDAVTGKVLNCRAFGNGWFHHR
ncbi:hypothetical protein [Anaerovibrio sp.]|uniref:hypothetical protein n=1 Tax=Anaerovibrio sp. TaxID=1872532 RepID=UPI0038904EE4